ncbi:MAG: M23 family metallopeptidase [Clostridiales bacterium]|nr:M23 family metallopeptidase [Clostridiales bacterium]
MNNYEECFLLTERKVFCLSLLILLLIIFCPSLSKAGGVYVWPVPSVDQSHISQRYGESHEGIDIYGAEGTPIVAAKDGTLYRIIHGDQSYSDYKDAGNAVVIWHEDDGTYTHYCHLVGFAVTERDLGTVIHAGEPIGFMGRTGKATGDHLHFAVADNPTGGGGRINNNPDEVVYIPLTEYISDTLVLTARPRGLEVICFWTLTPDVVSHRFTIRNEAGTYSNVWNYPASTNFTHLALSEGKWIATIEAIDEEGFASFVSKEFELGRFELSVNTRGSLTEVRWNDFFADSYYAYIVEKATRQEVYSGNIGNVTAANFGLSDGNYIVYITAVKNGVNLKTASAEFTCDTNLHLQAATRGTYVDLSWNDIGADSYWAYVVNKATLKGVYSNTVGRATSVTYQFAEGEYIVYLTPTVDGVNGQTASAEFVCENKLNLKVNTRGTYVDLTWNDIGADSYWAQVVKKSNSQEVYSNTVGKSTSVTFQFAEGEYIVHLTPTTNGVNGRTESAEFTCDNTIRIQTDICATLVDISWNDIGADSYYLLLVNNLTSQEIISTPMGKMTSLGFGLEEGEYICYITPTTNGVNGKTASVVFSVRNAAASISKGNGCVLRANERVTLGLDASGYDFAKIMIYRTPLNGERYLYYEENIQSLYFATEFPDEGEYSCCFAITKGTDDFESTSVSWTVVENTFETLILPEDTESVESEAFACLDQGLNIVLGDKIVYIADDAFAGSDVLLTVTEGSYCEHYCRKQNIPYQLKPVV